MPVTIALGPRRRLSIGRSREAGWWAASWRRPSSTDDLGWHGGEEPPDIGVREPRVPPLSPRSGAAEADY
jgi:hypothetical protein